MVLMLSSLAMASSMTRTVPSTATASSTITATYTAASVPTGKWGAIIVENLAGGCTFPDGTAQYKSALLSSDGTTKTVSIQVPATGSCSMTGYYQFDTATSSTAFASSTITVGSGTCPTGQTKCSDGACKTSCDVTTCPSGQTKCSDGTCKASCDTPKESWFTKEIFKIGTFSVAGWMIIALGAILLIIVIKK